MDIARKIMAMVMVIRDLDMAMDIADPNYYNMKLHSTRKNIRLEITTQV